MTASRGELVARHPHAWEIEFWRRARRVLFGVEESRDGRRTVYRVGPRQPDPEGNDKPARQGVLW